MKSFRKEFYSIVKHYFDINLEFRLKKENRFLHGSILIVEIRCQTLELWQK